MIDGSSLTRPDDDLVAREYLRVSFDKSGRERSNEEQHGDNDRDATGRWKLGEHYSDRGSASRYATKIRGDFANLINDLRTDDPACRRGCRFDADILVIWESSRGSRKTGEWVDLLDLCEERGVRISVTTHSRLYDPANPRDRRSLLEDAVDSEYESGKTSLRVRRNTASAAAARRPHGKRLYGYERVYDIKSGALLGQRPHPTEAPVVRRIFDMYLAGHSIRTISRTLVAEGIQRPSGKNWLETTVAHTLDRPSYAGRRTWNGQDMGQADPDVWPPLVDPDTFDRVQERRKLLRERMAGGRRSAQGPRSRLLSGVARCGRCMSKMNVNPQHNGRLVYQCKGCARIVRGMERLDDYVSAWLLSRIGAWLADPTAADSFGDAPDRRAAAARARAVKLHARLDEAMDLWEREQLTAARFADMERRLLPQIAEAEREARRASVPLSVDLPDDPARLEHWWYEDLTGEQRREVVMAYISVVVVHPLGRGRRTYDESDYTTIERRR